ncbi:sensor domain-containing diguanylate cyclase [Conexibacter woesei]|uniref:sensor domain-containing diguanylate cyclase n=1 Tax=Conexibacter woesei TaxID=191495 RepID=UPI00040BFBE7|nr:sensor domain-containing diguanylate cyclase [Conexibacter woesei]
MAAAATFSVPGNELERLEALRALAILDTDDEQLYDDVVKLASAICDAPVAIINFIDADRQWGKAIVGLDDSEAPREHSFCSRAILDPDALFVVPDTHADPEWVHNPMVTGDADVRFYAGAPIVTSEGHALGTVCIADHVTREFTHAQREALKVLARQTAAHLELRKATRSLADACASLQHMAVHDTLTGLANRVLLHDRLELALKQRRRSGRAVGVLFGDLNGFKAINDTLGHHAGDELLKVVADRLCTAARETDTVARFAGDEFVIVLPELGLPGDIDAVALRMAAAVARPATLRCGDGATVTPAISLGRALARDDEDADTLLARADAAMYDVKRASKSAA